MTVLVITVLVGAVIGFGTNLIAIVMLFRPWNEWRLFGLRVPLTPGLVPKRQPEIARKLGEVVEEHLLTEEGVVSSLSRPEWIEEMRSRILAWIESVLAHDRTVRALLVRLTGQTVDELSEQVEKWARATYETRVLPELGSKRVRDLIPPALQERVTIRIDALADMLLEKARGWVASPDVRQFMASALQERLMGGGMLGRMAVMFVQEDKLVDELVPHLKNWLESPTTLRFIQDQLQEEWNVLLDRNAGDVLTALVGEMDAGDQNGEESLPEVIPGFLKELINKMIDQDLYELVEKNRPRIIDFLDRSLLRIQQSSVMWVTPILHSLGIRRIVEEQVASFPIPKLERLVVSVVKKELQMITWLGALLGGLIGLIQALLIIRWQ